MSCDLMSCSHCGWFPAQTRVVQGSGKHYGLSLWKTISTGEETVIEVFESLVGGIAVKTPVNSNSEAEANAMLEKLMNWVGEANLLTALRKLADKGLDLMAEYQDHFTDEWTPLVTPLHLAASGDFLETNEVISFVRHALEVYRKLGPLCVLDVWYVFVVCINYINLYIFIFMSLISTSRVLMSISHDLQRTLPCALQQTVMKAIKGCLDEIVPAQVEMSPQKVEIHKNIICDGCGSVCKIHEFNRSPVPWAIYVNIHQLHRFVILNDHLTWCHPSQVKKIHSLESASNVPLAKTLTCAKLATTSAMISTLNTTSIECLRHSALSFLWFAMDVGRRRFNQKIASSAWNVQTTTCVLRVLMIAAASTHIMLHGNTREKGFALHLLHQLSQNPKQD